MGDIQRAVATCTREAVAGYLFIIQYRGGSKGAEKLFGTPASTNNLQPLQFQVPAAVSQPRSCLFFRQAYPLRPELIESTLLVYKATGDPSWLWAGRDFLESLQASLVFVHFWDTF